MYVCIFSVFPESPRWLLAQGRSAEAWKVVKKISKWNGKQLSNNIVPYVKVSVANVSVLLVQFSLIVEFFRIQSW